MRLMSKIESVELTIWNDNGDSLSIDLEPWQVVAVVQILGLHIQPKGGNAYDISMLGQKGVKMLLDSIPYKTVKKSELK